MANKSYPKEHNLISTTDPKSIITSANESFCDVAEYQEDDLLGRPHNLVRHQDMPKPAFAQMWKYLKSGQSWMGLVKNSCAGGDHYWVSAFVTPIVNSAGEIEEHQSVRTKPTNEQIERAESLYKNLREGKKPGIKQTLRRRYNQWQLVLAAVLSLVSVAGLFSGDQTALFASIAALSCMTLFIGFIQQSRINAIQDLAKDSYDNALMEHPYTGKFDDYSSIELALMMRKAQLCAVAARTADTTGKLLISAEEEFGNTQTIQQQLNQQCNETEQVATAITELTHSIQEVSDSALTASQSTDEANNESLKGKLMIENTMGAVEDLATELERSRDIVDKLAEDSQKIEQILDVIGAVSEQTNLLALNAAIEAARAGEAGRGFAVVADEVRNLASKTQSSTHEIHAMIAQLQDTAKQAVSMMSRGKELSEECNHRAQETGVVLNNITEMLANVTDSSHQIATAVNQQANVTQEVNRNVTNIQTLANNTSETSSTSVTRTSDLVVRLESMQRLIGQFMR
ncbi:methyl-accepting chemotaxis protein [Vibrio tapetis]|uniref:Methyl-accepting chemotaxis protein n=1 Tax=Vibrio tapetis subsp. tapetis TaxID=1671868 RepID=A0A2N8ZAA5_9VIBR|nr:methyl-accepting chemotaxis protein [Vibrio tapetis]SON48832.1 Methyl-accepting chemotaxis protein [Vibrio tapetis subsp. tapetis]